MNYDIVPMTADHLDQAAEIERICFSDPWSRRMLSEHLENECAATLAALGEDGTVLGYAGLLVAAGPGLYHQRGRPAGVPQAGGGLPAAGGVRPVRPGPGPGLPLAGGPRLQRRRPGAL